MKKLILLVLLANCAHKPQPIKKTLVFIQGYHLDGSSWSEVRLRVPKEEFASITLDRISRDQSTPASLNEIARVSCKQSPKHSVLVAHSFGGAIATAMYGLCPEKIAKIIYISAVVPKNGEKPFDRMRNRQDQARYAKAVTFDKIKIYPREPKKFYAAMDPEVNINATPTLPKIYTEWMSLTFEVVNYDAEQFASLPKAYIVTEKDPVVGAATQEMFIKDAAIKEVQGIPTGHFPMIAKPELLSHMILKFAH
jgi:pimeloyl-ACP methyl ester carboxylesterase